MPYSRLYYHFVWTTKERRPFITEANRGPILKAIAAKVIQLNGICHAVNAVYDHVHLVATVPPSMALGIFIGQVKEIRRIWLPVWVESLHGRANTASSPFQNLI